jgi:hypothetical protein
MPICDRCKNRGIGCAYPNPKPSSFVVIQDTAQDLTKSPSAALFSPLIPVEKPSEGGLNPYICSSNFAEPWAIQPTALSSNNSTASGSWSLASFVIPPTNNPYTHEISVDWFLKEETWAVDHRPINVTLPLPVTVLKHFLRLAQRWILDYAQTGSNTFIHHRLYQNIFPECIQVAYTTLCSYVNKTDANEDLILRIVEERADALLLSNGVTFDAFDKLQFDTNTPVPTETRAHIARVHALLIYQVIGLFDGDIRARNRAEKRVDVISHWANQLFETASQSLSRTSYPDQPNSLSSGFGRPIARSEHRWDAWALAESVRRTWLVAMGVYSVYYALQENWVLCAGGIMFTNRQGIWNAKSAEEWEKLCTPENVEFIQRFDAEKFFDDSEPQHIDDFGRAMLEMTYGSDRLEKWMERHGYKPH